MIVLHIGAFHLDVDGQKATFWHRLTPRTRLVCALLFVFATTLTPNGRWLTWAIHGAGLGLLILGSRLTWPVLLRRVAIEMVFVSVVLVGTLFRSGGDVLWRWGWLQVTTMGLGVLGSVTAKALLCLVMMNLLVLTTSIPALLHGFAALGTPPILVAIMAAMYRYIGVLVEEFNTMQRAAASRNLLGGRWAGKTRLQRLVVGNMMGSLFIRTYERGDRVHQAMLSRGYRGLPLLTESFQEKRADVMAVTMTVMLLLLGQLIYLY
jgi:cobalt/nickel transport system permease protein